MLSSLTLVLHDGVGIFVLGNFAQWGNLQLEVMDEPRVELSKTNVLGNVANSFGSRPCTEQRVLGLSRSIAIRADVDAYELEKQRKDMALAQTQR